MLSRFGQTKTYGDQLRGDIRDNPPVLAQHVAPHRQPDGAVVADPTPALVRQASIADDETTDVALHSAGEGVGPCGVVGTGVLARPVPRQLFLPTHCLTQNVTETSETATRVEA